MSIIVFESVDGMGKSAVIEQLIKKYPDKFDSMAFPSEIFKQEINDEGVITPVDFNNNTLSTLIHYHTAFEIDFMVHIDEIQKKSKKAGHLLLDRYFISNIAYAEINFIKHGYQGHPFLQLLERIDHGIIPDLVICLKAYTLDNFPEKEDSHFTKQELSHVQYCYTNLLPQLRVQDKIKDYANVVLLSESYRNENLFEMVEAVVKEKGFL
ncbi:MAG: hypothetical protein L0H53_03535 [Candidatus Nitrosocosmicus sp.]|nr:hypothetical protein [Candidatus Nitrosocosmicus sp.]MDN5865944.1 hypothetical protein [Candidatus Nitrosocosmicus sp.]